MSIRKIGPFLLLLLALQSVAQPRKPLPAGYLQWSGVRRLAATDFQLKIRPQNNLKTSFADFGFQMQGNNYDLFGKQANQMVQNLLYSPGSYLDASAGENPELQLRYLQTLWDINEVAARHLRQELRAGAKRMVLIGKPDPNELFRAAYEAATKRQAQYADETNYGLFVDKQDAWEKQLAAELAELAAYALPN